MKYRVKSRVVSDGDELEIPDEAQHVELDHMAGGACVRVSWVQPVVEVSFSP